MCFALDMLPDGNEKGENMKEKFAKLINVKSMVTILLTLLFVFLGIRGSISQEVMTIYTTVIAFYFGTQFEKREKDDVSR